MKENLVFLVGPTATGKSEAAVYLAKKINAEIISCDSMQIYKNMDIITSKPSRSLIKQVPHHLISVVSPNRDYNVARYRNDAIRKVKEIIGRGKVPLFVGGTGLYMSTLIDGIFKAKSQNKKLRDNLYRQAKTLGNAYLYNKLARVDPLAAAKIHLNDTKRIVRALEVFEVTGKRISELKKKRKGLTDKYDINIFCLDMERKTLYKRIEKRVEKMFKEGLANEVRELLKLKLSKTASCAIGIKELKGYFDNLYGLEEAKRLIKRNTRALAKRQLTWFRKEKRIRWINDEEKPKDVAHKIWKELY
jgi:tRNA dimethylallyltransferase